MPLLTLLRSFALLLLGLDSLTNASPTQRFLQSSVSEKTTLTSKLLPAAADYIAQLNFAVTDTVYCNKSEVYAVADDIYGMIRGPTSPDNPYLYTLDKAVTWFSNHAFLAGLVNQRDSCCDVGNTFEAAMTQCMCNFAASVEIAKIDGTYATAAIDAKVAKVTPVSPQWTNVEFHKIFARSYEWVFHDVRLVMPMEELQSTCQPSRATWDALQAFNAQGAPGLEAYFAIMSNGTYGAVEGGQMFQLKCASSLDVQTGEGGCGCKGSKDGRPFCHTDTDVSLFCGSGGVKKCDPRPFLCPEDELPVGFVRAYLHKFLDASPYFHGHGYADEHGEFPEFIVWPNMRADSGGVSLSDSAQLFNSCVA